MNTAKRCLRTRALRIPQRRRISLMIRRTLMMIRIVLSRTSKPLRVFHGDRFCETLQLALQQGLQ